MFFLKFFVSISLSLLSEASLAFEWKDLWATPQQQGHALMQKGDFKTAEKCFKDVAWKGAAAYRGGNYRQAAAYYPALKTADGYYNQGNSLVQLGQYEAAIKAYDAALAIDPTHKDAKFNRDKVKLFLKQHPQQSSKDQQSQNSSQENHADENYSQEDKGHANNNADNSRAKDNEGQAQEKASKQEQEQRNEQNYPQDASEKDATDRNKQEMERKETERNKTDHKEQDGAQSQKQKAAKEESPDPAVQASKGEDSKSPENKIVNDKKSEAKDRKMDSDSKQNSGSGFQQRPGTVSDQKIEAELSQRQEQWLRLIPDDPGGLLREKFLREHQRRERQ